MNIHEFNGEAAIRQFNRIRPWLQTVLEKSANYATIGDVWDMLANERATLWLGFEDHTKLVGFAVTEPIRTAQGPWVNIPFAYCEGDLDYDWFFGRISVVSKWRGMAGVKFISYRNGFDRVAKQHGWEKGYTEYIVSDFRGGNE